MIRSSEYVLGIENSEIRRWDFRLCNKLLFCWMVGGAKQILHIQFTTTYNSLRLLGLGGDLFFVGN